MHIRYRFRLWFLPLLGILLGLLCAFMFLHGLVVTWHLVGKPPENISEIIGVVDGNQLFIRTDSGDIYSFKYMQYINQNYMTIPPIEWTKEEKNKIEPDPIRKSIMTFISWPMPFKVKQLCEMTYQLVEGEMLTKFALSEDGNLWIWNYGVGGMAGLTYYIFPFIGFFIGSVLFLIVKVGIFLRTK